MKVKKLTKKEALKKLEELINECLGMTGIKVPAKWKRLPRKELSPYFYALDSIIGIQKMAKEILSRYTAEQKLAVAIFQKKAPHADEINYANDLLELANEKWLSIEKDVFKYEKYYKEGN